MPGPRLPMRKIRDVLRLSAAGMSKRKIAASLGDRGDRCGRVPAAGAAAGMSWPLPEDLSDEALERRLYPPPPVATKDRRPQPDWAAIHRELRRQGVTLQLLWEEHRAAHPDGYGYSRFCELYRAWEGRLSPTMRQAHVAGERLFVDYAGTTLEVIDGATGEVHDCQLFVAVLGASNYTYAEATWTQGLSDWIGSHTRAFAFFGGVPAMVVSDNLKSGITKACFYEPAVNRTYAEMAAHYDTADRAGAAQEAARQGQGRSRRSGGDALDHRQAAQPPVLLAGRAERRHPGAGHALNDRVTRHLGASRRALFEEIERSALKPLPAEPYVYAEWKECRVGPRLPRRGREALLLGAAHAAAREGVGTDHGAHHRGLPSRQARRRACALVIEPQAHDGARAHAVEPPALCRLDAGAHPAAGRRDRAARPRRWSRSSCASARTPSKASAPAIGILRLRQELWPRAAGGRLRPGARDRRALLHAPSTRS